MNQSHAPGVTTEVLRRNSKEAIWNSSRASDISMWIYREKVRPVRGHYLDTRRCAQLANYSRERRYVNLGRRETGHREGDEIE